MGGHYCITALYTVLYTVFYTALYTVLYTVCTILFITGLGRNTLLGRPVNYCIRQSGTHFVQSGITLYSQQCTVVYSAKCTLLYSGHCTLLYSEHCTLLYSEHCTLYDVTCISHIVNCILQIVDYTMMTVYMTTEQYSFEAWTVFISGSSHAPRHSTIHHSLSSIIDRPGVAGAQIDYQCTLAINT